MSFPVCSDIIDDRNFIEWHKGIRYYGVWCLPISNTQWLQKIQDIQQKFSHVLLPNYLRMPHITIATVGLMCATQYVLVRKQLNLLASLLWQPIVIQWQGVSSYAHSPIIKVTSPHQQLCYLRKTLHQVTQGDDTDEYDPHITLGYYNSVVNLASLINQLAIKIDDEMLVNELCFCTYATDSIKSELIVQEKFILADY